MRERMSQLVKRLKRAVVRVMAGGKASLLTCRVASECLLLSMAVTAEGPGALVFYQYNHLLISSWQVCTV